METVETKSDQLETNNHAEIDIENPYLTLATSVRNELESLYPLSGECTIHRVQESLRQVDEKAYTPQVVSIGPIHRNRAELKAMEQYKRRYLQNFLRRTEVRLEDFIKVIKEKEVKLRNCYAERIELLSDDFVKMILMDAAFIFEVLLKSITWEYPTHDRLFGIPRKRLDINSDLYMLENQLPFFILQKLFTLANVNRPSNKAEKVSIDWKVSILKLIHEFSKSRWDFSPIEANFEESKYSEMKHLIDFLRICIVPLKSSGTKKPEILTTPSITKLHQAGVKFKLATSKNIFDITFRNGRLEIPRITIRRRTIVLMKNILAFEQSQCYFHDLNHYVILMNYLVNTPKDVDLLVQRGIIYNPNVDSEGVSTFFHSLAEKATLNRDYFYFSSLVEELNEYCKRPWHKWKANLKQDYFTTPWTTVSVIAAIVLLILTLLQTVCSILQVK